MERDVCAILFAASMIQIGTAAVSGPPTALESIRQTFCPAGHGWLTRGLTFFSFSAVKSALMMRAPEPSASAQRTSTTTTSLLVMKSLPVPDLNLAPVMVGGVKSVGKLMVRKKALPV